MSAPDLTLRESVSMQVGTLLGALVFSHFGWWGAAVAFVVLFVHAVLTKVSRRARTHEAP